MNFVTLRHLEASVKMQFKAKLNFTCDCSLANQIFFFAVCGCITDITSPVTSYCGIERIDTSSRRTHSVKTNMTNPPKIVNLNSIKKNPIQIGLK